MGDDASLLDTMADVNVNAAAEQAPAMAPPTRTDDQILPGSRWFWDIIRYDRDIARYICQLDEKWFYLTKYTLIDALQITPINNNNPFSSPSTPDALINFVNNLGYPKGVRTLSAFMTNDMFELWRALTTIINLCLTGKTLGFERPKSSDYPLHLPYEEYILGYLKFSAKGTKQEVFRMPILNELITADIQGEQYCKEYLEKVAKHQRYLAVEEGSDPNSTAPKPAKSTKKSKPPAPKAAAVTKPAAAQQPKPKPAPAKTQEKKHEFVDEEADMQRAVEESLKSVHNAHRGPLLSMVIREPDSRKFQPLPEVQGKGKAKRRTPASTEPSGHAESPSIYAKLGLTDSDSESDEEVPHVVKVRAQDEGKAGSNPGVLTQGQAGSNPSDDAEPQPQSSPVVHAGPNLKYMDLEATDVSTQQNTKQMDEGFTATTYPNIQENLKLTVNEQVILEEPASSTGTLSSLQHLAKDFSFGDLFFNDKPSESENEKTTAKTKAESMVSVIIQQDTSAIPPMTTPVRKAVDEIVTDAVDWAIQAPLRNRFRDLLEADMKEILYQRMWQTNSYKAHEDHMMLYEALEKSMNRDHTDELLKDLAEARRKKKKRHDLPKTPLGSPPHQLPPPPPAGPYGTSGSLGASGSSQLPLPPPPSSTSQSDQSKSPAASSSLKTAASAEYTAWTTTNTRLRPSVSSIPEDLHMDDDTAPNEQPLEEDRPATPESAWSIPSSDMPVLTNNWAFALASTYTPPLENSLLAQIGDMAIFMDWFCKQQGITELKPQYLEGPTFELVKVFHPNVIHLRYQMEECHKLLTNSLNESIIRYNVSKPLPLGGPPGQVTIQSDFFFNKDLEYLRYSSKGGRPMLSISKMKAAYYPDVGLEQMVPDQMWIEEECKAVWIHMRILSVVRIEVFSMYGYDYMKKIVLRRVNLNEHIIAERYFKYLYPSDFEDLYLLNLQSHLNHLPPKDKKILTTAVNLWIRHLVIRQRVEDFHLGIESYQTQLNFTKPRWDATGFEYKHDFMVIDSSRAITFRDKYEVQMIMRFNVIHKFSDDTLYQIDEALDYRVKEFKVNRMNLGLNTRFWTRKDVDRSKEFMFAIQKRLKTRRIFCNMECFIGGRLREGDYILLQGTE
uniref:E-beta-farnesene synthase n=1 Tax=Tanacetum cinerariifolium TaxID=118510 RepID=A0A6L2NRN9_TANCI|nr:hypothetical protein [Tanacetum cinerariifolium]